MNKMIKSVALVTVIGLITRTLSFVFRIVLSRNLDAHLLGVYQVSLSVFIVLLSFTSSGLPLAISKLTAENKSDNSLCSKFTTSGILVGFAFSAVCTIVLLLGSNIIAPIFVEKQSYPLLLSLLPALFASSFYSSFRGSLWGQDSFFKYSIVELIDEVVCLLSISVLFYFNFFNIEKIYIPGIAISISYMVATFASAVFYFKSGLKLKPPKTQLERCVKLASPITFVRVLSSFSSSILSLLLPSRLIMFGLSKIEAMELIGLVTGIAFPLLFVPSSLISSLSLVLVPSIAKSIKKGEDSFKKIKTSLTFGGVVSSLLVPFYIVLGIEICDFIFLKGEGGVYLAVSAVTMVPLCLNQLAVTILNSSGGEKYNFRNFLIGGSISILSVLFLTPHIGIYSIILSMFLQSFIVFTLNCKNISTLLGFKFWSLFSEIKYALLILPTVIIGFFVKSFIKNISTFWTLVIVSFFMLVFVSLILYVFLKKDHIGNTQINKKVLKV